MVNQDTFLFDESILCRKVQERARRIDVGLEQHQSKGAVEHPQGEAALHPGDLVVVELHGIDRPAAIRIILRIGAEDAGEQYSGLGSQGMAWMRLDHGRLPT